MSSTCTLEPAISSNSSTPAASSRFFIASLAFCARVPSSIFVALSLIGAAVSTGTTAGCSLATCGVSTTGAAADTAELVFVSSFP